MIISRQKKYQLKHKKLGLCLNCNQKAITTNLCLKCQNKQNKLRKKQRKIYKQEKLNIKYIDEPTPQVFSITIERIIKNFCKRVIKKHTDKMLGTIDYKGIAEDIINYK